LSLNKRDFVLIAPVKELIDRVQIDFAGAFVANGSREELDEAAGGVVTSLRDNVWQSSVAQD